MRLSPKTLGLLLISLLLSGCTLTPRPAQESPRYYLAEAQALIVERRYSEAIAILETGAAALPDNTALLVTIGQIYLAQQRWPSAEDAFNRALARDFENVAATVGLAESLLQQERFSQALKFWQRATRLDPTRPAVFTGLGRTWLALFDFEAARTAFVAQTERATDYEALWYLAALTAPLDVAAALEYLQRIPPAAEGVPTSLTARRDYLATTLEPFNAAAPPVEVAQAVGIAFVQEAQWPLAIYALEQALAQHPVGVDPTHRAETLAFLAHARAQVGHPALDLFAEARAADPDSALPLYFEGLYLRAQEAFNATEDRFEQAIARDPQNAAIYVEMARTRDLQGDLATAEVWYRAAIEVAENKEPFQRTLLRFYANRNYRMTEAAIPLAEALLEVNPEDADLYDTLGWLQFLSGTPDSGRAALQKALALDPTSISARYHLARYYESNRQSASARAEYQRVIDWDTSGVFREQAYAGLRRLADRE